MLNSGPVVQVVDYSTAAQCAGLTQAASELEGGESRYGRTLADAALFWTLTAFQAAATQGIPYATAETDQRLARVQSVRQLSANEAKTQRELQVCRQKTPSLD